MKTYIDLAMTNDLLFYRDNRQRNSLNNNIVIIGQQFIEKALKGILREYTDIDKDDAIFKTHNIKSLCRTVSKFYEITSEQSQLLTGADGYYFSVRCPGDDYFDIVEEDLYIMDKAVNCCEELLNNIIAENSILVLLDRLGYSNIDADAIAKILPKSFMKMPKKAKEEAINIAVEMMQ